MLTDYGKMLRKLRIDNGEVLKNMADKLQVSSSYLSSIECGKRTPQTKMTNRIIKLYHLQFEEANALKEAEIKSRNVVELSIENLSNCKQELAIKFARSFKELDDDTAIRIKKLLIKEEETEN